jgi:thiol-disulfide isomerase/thioredoxin
MSVLIAAVVFVGALCLFDLVLSLGVIRRLREQSTQLTSLLGAGPGALTTVAVGQVVGAFTASTTTGETVTRDRLEDMTLVGFFSPNCAPCAAQLPQFVTYAETFAGPVLAIAAGPPEQTADLVAALSGIARVVAEADDGAVSAAFGVRGYPTLLLVDASGRVQASGTAVAALPVFA